MVFLVISQLGNYLHQKNYIPLDSSQTDQHFNFKIAPREKIRMSYEQITCDMNLIVNCLTIKFFYIICIIIITYNCVTSSLAVATSRSAFNIVLLAWAFQSTAVSLAIASEYLQQMFRSRK